MQLTLTENLSILNVPCRHCHDKPMASIRGLCDVCINNRGIRILYPIMDLSNIDDLTTEMLTAIIDRVSDYNGVSPLPDRPTDAEPGSIEKIEVLRKRASKKQALHHPLDRKLINRKSRDLK